MPLMPEPLGTQDGTDKKDCERSAAKRFVAKRRQDHPHLRCIVTEESLRAPAPPLETLHAPGLHAILGVTEGEHAARFQQVQAAEHAGRVPSYERHARAAEVIQRFRGVQDLPLHAANPHVQVHCIASWELGPHQGQHFSWVTDLGVSKRNG
jgi:hypothetical protein